jgi:hypothetical protein
LPLTAFVMSFGLVLSFGLGLALVVRIAGIRGEVVGGAVTWCGAAMWGVKINKNL